MIDDATWEALRTQPEAFFADPSPELRRLAVAVADATAADAIDTIASNDADPTVRAAAVERSRSLATITAALADTDPTVVEAAVTASGELEDPAAVPRLIQIATGHPEKLVQEAAVAALGAIGDLSAVDTLLELLTSGPPQIRRRSVAALTVFDDERILPALRNATSDRNPMVREVAEMVVGAQPEWTTIELSSTTDN